MMWNLSNFFLSGAALAGIAVLWRTWIEDHPTWKKYLQEKLGGWNKLLLCGSCFTYWIALLFTLTASPLSFWMPYSGDSIGLILNTIFQWMALAWLTLILRFSYVALQELVHYQVHSLNNGHEHKK